MSIADRRIINVPNQGQSPSVAVVYLFVVVAGTLSFLPINPTFYPRLVQATFDALHFPAGGVLIWLLIRHIRLATRYRRVAASVVLAAAIIIAVEALQTLIAGRQADFGDVMRGMAGVAIGASLLPGESSASGVHSGRLFWVGMSLASIALLAPVSLGWLQVARVNSQPTIIANFEQAGAGWLWKREWGSNSYAPEIQVVQGQWVGASRALEVQIRRGGWSGASTETIGRLFNPAGIFFTAFNPGDMFDLYVQIRWLNASGESWVENRSTTLENGVSSVSLALSGPTPSTTQRRIASILFYAKEPAGSRVFYLDDVGCF